MITDFLKKHFKRQPSSVRERDVDLANCSTSTAIGAATAAADIGSNRIRMKLFNNVKITQREKRDKLVNSKRGGGDMNMIDHSPSSSSSLSSLQQQANASQSNATYLVGAEIGESSAAATSKRQTSEEAKREQTNNRRKMLEEWRAKKKRENEMKQAAAAAAPKPTFKVHHVDNRLFEKSTLPTSSSFNFHMRLDTSNQSATCKRAYTFSNLHSSSATTTGAATTSSHHSTSSLGQQQQVKKPVTRSQSKLESKKPTTLESKLPTSRDKPQAPVRSVSSVSVSAAAAAAKKTIQENSQTSTTTRRQVSASSVGTSKKQTQAPKPPLQPPSSMMTPFVAPAPPPPPPSLQSNMSLLHHHQPLATSSTSDLLAAEVDRISNKIGSSVTISTSSSQRINKRLSQQPPKTPAIVIEEPREVEKRTPTLEITVVKSISGGEEAVNTSAVRDIDMQTTTTPITASEPAQPPQTLKFDSAYFESVDLDKRDVIYYKNLVEFKTRTLNDYGAYWTETLSRDGALVPDDVQGDVRSACGLAKLLIDERFDQFSDLIRQCENAQAIAQSGDVSEMPALVVRCTDLQGFWDMVEYQVQDVSVRFEYLEKLKANGYVKTAELDEFLEKKMNSNKPKEAEKKPTERSKVARSYLKKPAKSSDENKTTSEPVAAAKPKPAVSRFAEFRKAKLQQANAVVSPPVDVEIMLPPMPKTPGPSESAAGANANQSDETELLNSAQTKSGKTRRSRKSNIVLEPKRYNLRSRPSDLIKFDSPVRNNGSRASILPSLHTLDEDTTMNSSSISEATTAKQTLSFDPFSTPGAANSRAKKPMRNHVDLLCEEIRETAEEEDKNDNEQDDEENKENTVIDYLGECGAVLGSAPINVMTLKMRASIAPQSAYTPQKSRVSLAVRESLEPDRISNLSRSPLLKLALISSHSKRLSLSRPTDFPPL